MRVLTAEAVHCVVRCLLRLCCLQASSKYSVIFLVTKFGYLHVYDLESGAVIFKNRITQSTIFVTAYNSNNGGIIGVNRAGQVLTVTIDEATIIQYIQSQLKNPQLALSLAVRWVFTCTRVCVCVSACVCVLCVLIC